MPLSHKLAASSGMERRTFSPEKTRCFVLLFILRTLLDPKPTSALNDEGAALLEFGSRLNDTGGNLRGWNSSHSTPCRWTGVTCSKDKLHVVSISVPGKQLEGNLTLDVTPPGLEFVIESLSRRYSRFLGEFCKLENIGRVQQWAQWRDTPRVE